MCLCFFLTVFSPDFSYPASISQHLTLVLAIVYVSSLVVPVPMGFNDASFESIWKEETARS